MNKFIIGAACAALAGTAAISHAPPPASGDPAAPATWADLIRATPPVTDQDINDRPYRILGEVRAEVRKATIFSRAPSRAHVFRELWERARRLHADAVVNATAGNSRITGMSWGSRRSFGQAVHFLTDAEIAQGQTGEHWPLSTLPNSD